MIGEIVHVIQYYDLVQQMRVDVAEHMYWFQV